MSIRFTSIKSKEVLTAESEPHIAALWSSSDRSPNVAQGQDMGWRLHPEVVAELEDIKRDPDVLEKVARMRKKEVDELTEYDILFFISGKNDTRNKSFSEDVDYSDDYELEVRRAKKARAEERRRAEFGGSIGEAMTVPAIVQPVAPDAKDLSDDELLAELERRTAKKDVYPVVKGGIRYFRDGDKICAVHDATFVNLEESPAGFGATEEEAAEEFSKAAQISNRPAKA